MVIFSSVTNKITSHKPWFLVEYLKLEYQLFLCEKLGFVYHVIKLASQDPEVLYTEKVNIYPHT